MAELICMGEALIDFTPSGNNADGTLLFARNPGGAPANVAVQAARLGISSAFMGKVGADMFGTFLRDVLGNNKVDVSRLTLDDNNATTLAFVALSEAGDRDFSFYRNPGADTQISKDEIDFEFIKNAKLLCFGSLLLTNDPSRSAVCEAVRFARENGVITAYDPNWRPPLWANKEYGIEMMRSLVPFADIMKVSDEELMLITNCTTLKSGAEALILQGVQLVVCTLGAMGCIMFTKDFTINKATYNVKVKDTTGSGDSFFGALLSKVISSGKGTDELTRAELNEMAEYSNAAGSACATKSGAIPALPTNSEIENVRKTVSISNN